MGTKVVIDLGNYEGWSNVKGSADYRCGCGSWIKHWEKFSGEDWPKSCSVKKCTKKASVGAHIQQRNDEAGKNPTFIAPLCKDCNGKGADIEFDLVFGTVLVSANQSKTCKKPEN